MTNWDGRRSKRILAALTRRLVFHVLEHGTVTGYPWGCRIFMRRSCWTQEHGKETHSITYSITDTFYYSKIGLEGPRDTCHVNTADLWVDIWIGRLSTRKWDVQLKTRAIGRKQWHPCLIAVTRISSLVSEGSSLSKQQRALQFLSHTRHFASL
jgi:hypothetical protein